MTAPDGQLRSTEAEGREGLREIILLLVAAVLAGLLLYFLFHGKLTRFDEIGLGEDTSAVFAAVNGDPIHCGDLTNAEVCVVGFARRGATQAAVWFGNSQLHGVNQYQLGQETAAARLFARLEPRHLDLVTFSQPNANLQEHLVLYGWLRHRLPIRWVLLPVVFDDFRESNIRDTITPALDDASTRALLEQSAVGQAILARTETMSDPDLAALEATVQERSESFLNGWLERNVELWELRPEARGRIANWIRGVRNFVFRIKATSKRRLIEGPYQRNLEALEAILSDAEASGIRVLVYVAPIRGEVELPYNASEYARFRHDVERVAAERGAVFRDLQSVVPAALFGFMRSDNPGVAREPDFMHFQAGGHAILADRLAEVLEAEVRPDRP